MLSVLSDDLGEKKFAGGLIFGMWASFHLRNIALREITYAKNNLAFPSHVFRSLFVEQERGRLFIVYEVKIKSHSI